MPRKCDQVSVTRLRPATTREAYDVHVAALQWSLLQAIILESEEDVKSRPNWRDDLKPYAHQVQNLFTFCRRLPVTLIADDVGLGKTISAGLILAELTCRRRVKRVLIVCPKILCPQWREELGTKFGIEAVEAFGGDLDRELRGRSSVIVTTYHSISNRLARLNATAFDMLILDEAHKVRNLYGTDKPPQVAVNLRRALAQRHFRYVLMLTATPMQNRLWDLYSLLDCLAVAKGEAEHPMGSPNEFAAKYLVPFDLGDFRNA